MGNIVLCEELCSYVPIVVQLVPKQNAKQFELKTYDSLRGHTPTGLGARQIAPVAKTRPNKFSRTNLTLVQSVVRPTGLP